MSDKFVFWGKVDFIKVLNLDFQQTAILMQKYPVKTNYIKLWSLWLVPWIGSIYVFVEIIFLQSFINKGFGVFEYLEYKLQKNTQKQNN